MPAREDNNINTFEGHLNFAMGAMEFARPFGRWPQDSATNGVTEAPDAGDDHDEDVESLGHDNKENDPSLLPANLPGPSTRRSRRSQQQSRPQAQHSRYGQGEYRLSPRKKVKPELDFEIYQDERTSVGTPFKWEYYGSNVPALGERKNMETFNYTVEHQIRRYQYQLRDEAIRTGDEDLYNLVERVREHRYTTWQRFSGAIEWMAGSDPMDVWLWVQAKRYHKRWNKNQIEQFQEFLKFMKQCILNAIVMKDDAAAEQLDKWNTSLINGRFRCLGLPNLHMVKNNRIRVSFMPDGPDEKLLYRADYTLEELEILDAGWEGPGRWAPGEGPEGNKEYAENANGEDSEGEESEHSRSEVGGEVDIDGYLAHPEGGEESEPDEASYVFAESSDLIAM
ncbi:hypothetical protein MKX07_003996 [Trichoderma sp. CBMAI-0711]|nr:hypothetical protein MKX07_003996 [Trichoderma sp. CBMAI-0711]